MNSFFTQQNYLLQRDCHAIQDRATKIEYNPTQSNLTHEFE